MDIKTIGRMIATSLAVFAICGCSESSSNDAKSGFAAESDARSEKKAVQKIRSLPKITDMNGGELYMVCVGELEPKPGAVYKGDPDNAKWGFITVVQVLGGGVLCHVPSVYSKDHKFSTPRDIFVITKQQHVDGSPLKGINFLCVGTRSYNNELGARKTVYVFEEVPEETLKLVEEEQKRLEGEKKRIEAERTLKEKLRPDAQAGDAYSQTVIGWLHETGTFGVKKDIVEAAKWYGRASAQNFPDAQYHYALCLANGLGVERNPQEAARLGAVALKAARAEPIRTDTPSPGWKLKQWRHASVKELESRVGGEVSAKALKEGMSSAFRSDRMYRANAERGDAFAQYLYVCENMMQSNVAETVKWYRSAAEHGFVCEQSAEAQYLFGRFYASTNGGNNVTEAVKCYAKAAEQGLKEAQVALYMLGRFYASVEGGNNVTEAVKCYTKAAKHGLADAQVALGDAYSDGVGVEKDTSKATDWYRKAAEQGASYAQERMGHFCENGIGVATNLSEAVKWYELAAEQTNINAMCRIMYICDEKTGPMPNGTLAEKCCRMAAEAGVADAQYMMGCRCKRGGDLNGAVEWYRKADVQGHTAAQLELALCYVNGCSGLSVAPEVEVKWLRLAAEHGHAVAQCRLGTHILSSGDDTAEAMKWFRKSADQNNADGQYQMGMCCAKGCGMETNLAEAVKWYSKAAEQDHAEAQAELAAAYDRGLGVETNFVKAAKWYGKMAERGEAAAQNRMGEYCRDGLGGIEKNLDQAEQWFRDAAKLGMSNAQFNLAELLSEQAYTLLHFSGRRAENVSDDEEDFEADDRRKKATKLLDAAKQLYGAAAEQGHKEATYRLTLMALQQSGASSDHDLLKRLFNAAASGTPRTWELLGAVLVDSDRFYQDIMLSINFSDLENVGWGENGWNGAAMLKRAADGGNAVAARLLGLFYQTGVYHGRVSIPADETFDDNNSDASAMAKAVKWYTVAAKQGDPIALCNLATCYLNGWKVKKNETAAVNAYRKSVELGMAMFEREKAKLKDAKMSAPEKMVWELYLKTIRLGIASAQLHLGERPHKGVGVEQNADEERKQSWREEYEKLRRGVPVRSIEGQ